MSRRKTKIICTLGPACWSVETLGALVDAGMNVARLNFSHGDHEGHAATLTRLRTALSSRRNKHVAVMLDTKVKYTRIEKDFVVRRSALVAMP